MDIERLAGTTLGDYTVESLICRGSMGTVYKARSASRDQPVALKILDPRTTSAPSLMRWFEKEARDLIPFLNHQNISQLYDVERDGDIWFLSMEYAAGRTLRELIEEGPIEVQRAVGIIAQVARALEHVHRHHIVHRDIKPSHIMVDNMDNVKVMDFALARVIKDRIAQEEIDVLMKGVPYVSPEQLRGRPTDARTDIFQVGVVFYEMLTGKYPFDEGRSLSQMLRAVLEHDPPKARKVNTKVPRRLSKVVARAMAKKKEDRYANMGEFLEALSAF